MATRSAFTARVISAFAILGVLLAGCASSTGGGGGAIKTGPGIDATNKTITLGILTPLSGPVAAPIGIPLTRGIDVYFQSVNANGGINGWKVNLVKKDTKYSPQAAVTAYNEIHNQVAMLGESLGTPPTVAIKDLAASDHMLVSAATLASSLAREKYLVLVGTPYRLQVENAFDYVVNTLKDTKPKTGIIYQNDEYGQDGLQGYKESITAYGLDDVGQASYAVTDTDFTAQVSQMKQAGAKYVFLSTLPTVTATIVGTAAKLGYFPQFIMQSPAWSNLLLGVKVLVPLFTKMWIVGQGATWGDTSKPGMAQLLQDVQKYAPSQQPDGYFEFGYTESYITYAILKKAFANNDLTRDGLYNAFLSLKNVDLGGLYPPVTYGSSPNQRVPTRDSVVFQIDPTQPNDVRALTPDFTGTASTQSQF